MLFNSLITLNKSSSSSSSPLYLHNNNDKLNQDYNTNKISATNTTLSTTMFIKPYIQSF